MKYVDYDTVINRVQYLEGIYNAKKEVYEKTISTVKDLEEEQDILEKTDKVLKLLIDKLIKKDLSQMDKLITYGLNTVFPDRNAKFLSEVEEKNKKLHIHLHTICGDKIIDPDTQSSISVIESVLLRIISMIKLKRAPLLLLDETFSAVDAGYIENVSKLMNQIAQKLDIDILSVTHTPGFSEYANSSFEITQTNNTVKIEKIK